MSLQIIEYDPKDPWSCTRRRSATGASLRVYLYSRDASAHGASSSRYSGSASLASTSFISPDEAEAASTNVVKRLWKDFSQTEQLAITWTKRRAVLNSVTTSGWLRNLTDKEKSNAEEYVAEIVGQANLKFASKLEATFLVVNWVYKSLLHDRTRLAKTSETLLDCHNLKPSNPNPVDGARVEDAHREGSWVPVLNQFVKKKLGPLGLDPFRMLVIDIMYECELGTWKALSTHAQLAKRE